MTQHEGAKADSPLTGQKDMPAERKKLWTRLARPDHSRTRLYASSTPFLWVWLILVSLACWQINTNMFGFSSLTQNYSQDITGLALTGPLYPTTGRERVSVALIEDQTLKNLHMTWPWSYGDHARALESLLAYRPRAVVVDILFVDPRADPTLGQLLAVIGRYERAKVPLYFTGAPELDPPVREEIRASGVRLVDATILLDRGLARQYPMEGVCLDSHVAGTSPGSRGCASLALRLYEDVFQRGTVAGHDKDSHIELVWGVQTNPINSKWMRVKDDEGVVGPCPESPGILRRLYLAIVDVNALRSRCPYTGVIPADALLLSGEDKDVQTLVHDRVVFYGASLEGSADLSFTPSNGLLASVFVHAMALDNLITFEGHAKRDTVTVFGTTFSSTLVQSFTVGLILLFLTLLQIRNMRQLAGADPQAKEGAAPPGGSQTLAYWLGAVRRFAWYGFALFVIVMAGVTLYTFFDLSIGNWIQMVFLTGVLLEFLMSTFLGRAWGYFRHALSG